uniref:Putative ovule protein n=1 Tax=Solanum chacoense TaxID=4108 RepID=A0A0V0HMS1_SOLCH
MHNNPSGLGNSIQCNYTRTWHIKKFYYLRQKLYWKMKYTLRGGGLPSAGYLSYVVCELLHRSRGFTLCTPKG